MPAKVESCVSDFMSKEANKKKWPDMDKRRSAAYAICNTAIKNEEQSIRGYFLHLDNVQFEEDSNQTWVHLLPYVDDLTHPVFGNITIDEDKVNNMVKNFKRNVRGIMLDVDYVHKDDVSKGEKAAGWIVALDKKDDGLWGLVSWTGEARKEIEDGAWKYMSAEYAETWTDAKGKVHHDVLFGAALTNRPFMKDLSPINLSEVIRLDGFEVPEGKFSHEDANYRQASASTYRCLNCSFFRDGSCLIVDGEIDPDWTCNHFQAIYNDLYAFADKLTEALDLDGLTAQQKRFLEAVGR